MRRGLVLLMVLSLALSSQFLAYAQQAEQPTDLGPGMALGVNERGVVVGVTPHEFAPATGWIWRRGERTELETLGGAWTLPRAISNRGHVVGASATADGTRRAFLWQDGRMRDLGTLGGAASEALAVNERGEVVGWSEDGDGRRRAFHWYSGEMTDLGTLGGPASTARAISASGKIVGTAQRADGSESAVLWVRGHEIVDLEAAVVPDHLVRDFLISMGARDINDGGRIVGEYDDGRGWGFRLDGLRAASPVLLEPVGFWSRPAAINNAGITVGCGADEIDGCHAAAWDKDGRALRLPGLQPTHAPGGSAALDINNGGIAVGWAHVGTFEEIEFRAVLWHVRSSS